MHQGFSNTNSKLGAMYSDLEENQTTNIKNEETGIFQQKWFINKS